MKRLLCISLSLLLMLGALTGCSEMVDNSGVDVVCTVFPIYDWVDNLLGESEDDLSLRLLVNRGTDPHSYTPTPTDIAAIHSAEILIYVGGESDGWIDDVLETTKNENIKIIKLMDLLDGKLINADDCIGEECEDHEHEHEHESEHGAYDEHVWLSLKNALALCEALADELSAHLPTLSEKIKESEKIYSEQLRSLDARFEESVASAPQKRLIFADRFPFGYLANDYHLECAAAFSGCSADSEASFETVVSLSDKLREWDTGALVILESSKEDLAKTVISNSKMENVEIVVFDSIQSITRADIEGGATYLSIMEKNLAALSAALN